MIRLLLVDDHLNSRQKVQNDLSKGGLIKVIAEAETSDSAFKLSQQLLPDIVLLDLHLPGLLGPEELIKRLAALRNVKVIAFASESKASEVQVLLEAGASGYVLKSDPPALLRMAILMVTRGSRQVLSPSLPQSLFLITSEERVLLQAITQRGKLDKVAQRLNMAPEIFQAAINQLMTKLELPDYASLVKWAKKHGF